MARRWSHHARGCHAPPSAYLDGYKKNRLRTVACTVRTLLTSQIRHGSLFWPKHQFFQAGAQGRRMAFAQEPLGRFPEKQVRVGQALDELVIAFPAKIKEPGRRRVLVADAVEPAALPVNTGRVPGSVLRAVVAVVPVQDVKAAIGAELLRDGHEPRVMGGEEVGLAVGHVSGTAAAKDIDVDAAAVDVAHVEPVAVFLRVAIAVEVAQAAVGSLLMPLVGDRADGDGERRIGPGLALVVAGLDEMKEIIGGPVAGSNDGGAFGIPDQTVGIAGALAEELELARLRVDTPHGTGEVEDLTLAGDHAVVEDAVEAIQPAVGPPRERIGQFVGVGAAEACDDDLAAHLLAVFFLEKQEVRRVEDPDAAVADGNARGNVQSFGEDSDLVELAGARRVFKHLDPIAAWPG